MESEVKDTKIKSRRWKKNLLIIISVFVGIGVLAGAFFAFKYFFPSDKELFIRAHIKAFAQKDESPSVYSKKSKLSFDLQGDFTSAKAVDTVKSITVSTQDTRVDEMSSKYDFSMEFLGKKFLSFEKTSHNGIDALSIPQLTENVYASDRVENVLQMLFGSEQTAENIGIMDGVDREKLNDYLKEYGKMLYNNMPDSSFSSVKENDVKVVTFTTDADRLFYETADSMRTNTELSEFLYSQVSVIYDNINKKYPYAGTLLTVPEREEFLKGYNDFFEEFIKNTENRRIVATARIEGRELLGCIISVTENGVAEYDIAYGGKATKFVQYKEGNAHIAYTSEESRDGTRTDKHTKFSIDVNEYTKEIAKGQKIVSVIVDSSTDTAVTEKLSVPEKYTDISTMSEEEKTQVAQTVSENMTEMITGLTLALLFL